jgi:hypothetical protein
MKIEIIQFKNSENKKLQPGLPLALLCGGIITGDSTGSKPGASISIMH